eukprot:1690532-Prymnesium_polylepis.1
MTIPYGEPLCRLAWAVKPVVRRRVRAVRCSYSIGLLSSVIAQRRRLSPNPSAVARRSGWWCTQHGGTPCGAAQHAAAQRAASQRVPLSMCRDQHGGAQH